MAEFKQIVTEVHQEQEEDIPFSEKSTFEKVLFIFEAPFAIAGFVTIPPVVEDKLDSPLVCFYTLSSSMTFVLLNKCKSLKCNETYSYFLVHGESFHGMNYLIWAALGGILLFMVSVALYKTNSKTALSWIFAMLCLPVSIAWLSFAAGAIVDVISVSLKF